MSGIDIMPWALFATVAVASIVAVALAGGQAWVVPAVALPLVIAYMLLDRRMKRQEERRR